MPLRLQADQAARRLCHRIPRKKMRCHRHAGDNNCNYAAGKRRHAPAAADPAATDARREHGHK